MITNITEAYKNYAVYLPSLQEPYANTAHSDGFKNKRSTRPLNLNAELLDFLDSNCKLWTHNCTLYSCGQYSGSTITHRNMIAERKRGDNIVVGDSGGYQLGTNALRRKETKSFFSKYKDKPSLFAKRWNQSGEVERVVHFLNAYCDYSMTLDMVMWGTDEAKPTQKMKDENKSPLKNLSVQQCIDLTIENLKYIDSQRDVGNEHKTKWLNVTQCIGNVQGVDSGSVWYDAVKDFEFEGWAFGGGTAFHFHQLLRWVRKILNDKKFDNREWIHILMKSPPSSSILYTVVKHTINELANTDIQLTYDSSSHSQIVGKNRALFTYDTLTSDINTWTMSKEEVLPTKAMLDRTQIKQLPNWHPLSKFITYNDLVERTDMHQTSYFDVLSWELMRNYNMYIQHRRAIDACDLYFDSELQNHNNIPSLILELAEYASEFLRCENPNDFEQQHKELLRAYDSKFATIKAILPTDDSGWKRVFEPFAY